MVATLEQVTKPSMTPGVPAGTAERDILHNLQQRRLRHLHRQVAVIGHGASTMNPVSESFHALLQQQVQAIVVITPRKRACPPLPRSII
jgi:hypothetical protein